MFTWHSIFCTECLSVNRKSTPNRKQTTHNNMAPKPVTMFIHGLDILTILKIKVEVIILMIRCIYVTKMAYRFADTVKCPFILAVQFRSGICFRDYVDKRAYNKNRASTIGSMSYILINSARSGTSFKHRIRFTSPKIHNILTVLNTFPIHITDLFIHIPQGKLCFV